MKFKITLILSRITTSSTLLLTTLLHIIMMISGRCFDLRVLIEGGPWIQAWPRIMQADLIVPIEAKGFYSRIYGTDDICSINSKAFKSLSCKQTSKVFNNSCLVDGSSGTDSQTVTEAAQISVHTSHWKQHSGSCRLGHRFLALLATSSRHYFNAKTYYPNYLRYLGD